MAELPIMPLKTDALIADTTHMSAEEMGVYMRLLVAMWRHGARLPDDDTELARIGGISARRWRKLKERITRPMTSIGGFLTQKRISTTWLAVQELRAKRSHASLKRWGKLYPNGYSGDNQGISPGPHFAMLTKTKEEESPLSEYDAAREGLAEKPLVASPELTKLLLRQPRGKS